MQLKHYSISLQTDSLDAHSYARDYHIKESNDWGDAS
jgi:hypothetical protein